MRKFLVSFVTAFALIAGFSIYLSHRDAPVSAVAPAVAPAVVPAPEAAPVTTSEAVPDAAPKAAMSEAERTALRKEIRAYLLDSPEVLMEAIAVLESRQKDDKVKADRTLVEDNAEALFSDGRSWETGNPDGDVTLVEFMDYRCGFCRKAYPEVAKLLESDGNIRLIIKELPILGEQSTLSSRLALATLIKAGPEAYEKLHEFLITFNGSLSPATMRGMLENFEIDPEPVLAHMDSAEVTDWIAANRDLAGAMDISGTPTFVLGKDMVRGYVPFAGMREMVAAIRAGDG